MNKHNIQVGDTVRITGQVKWRGKQLTGEDAEVLKVFEDGLYPLVVRVSCLSKPFDFVPLRWDECVPGEEVES